MTDLEKLKEAVLELLEWVDCTDPVNSEEHCEGMYAQAEVVRSQVTT
jgi:hypothetical protein